MASRRDQKSRGVTDRQMSANRQSTDINFFLRQVGVSGDNSLGRGPIVLPVLGALIDDLSVADRWTPMLDWTSHGLAAHLPGWTLFRPVQADADELPYRDHTIEVV